MNRRAIYKFARGELERARRIAEPISLIFLDIDKFKNINDTHGHLVGDEALKLLAEVVVQRSHAYDGVGRWAGDEFMVVLPGTHPRDAEKAALRIIEGIATTPLVLPDNQSVHIRSSAGVASIQKMTNASNLLDTLIQAADEALYRAKDAGGNQVQVDWL